MPDWYAAQQVGVADGTKNPADRADGRLVGAHLKTIVASKVAGQVWANGDKIFLGRLGGSETIRRIWVNTDTTLGTTTLSIGSRTTAAKYANAKTVTAVDTPTLIGPLATTADDAPASAGEDIWMTLGVGGVAGAVNVSVELEIAALA